MLFDHRIWVKCVGHPAVFPGEVVVCTSWSTGNVSADPVGTRCHCCCLLAQSNWPFLQQKFWVASVNMSIHVTPFCDGKVSEAALVSVIKNKCKSSSRTLTLSFRVGVVLMFTWWVLILLAPHALQFIWCCFIIFWKGDDFTRASLCKWGMYEKAVLTPRCLNPRHCFVCWLLCSKMLQAETSCWMQSLGFVPASLLKWSCQWDDLN